MLVEKGQAGKITTRVEVAEQVRAPVEAGQRLGTLTIQSDGSPLRQCRWWRRRRWRARAGGT